MGSARFRGQPPNRTNGGMRGVVSAAERDLVARLTARGVALEVLPDGRLACEGPPDALTDDLVADLRELREGVVELLCGRDVP